MSVHERERERERECFLHEFFFCRAAKSLTCSYHFAGFMVLSHLLLVLQPLASFADRRPLCVNLQRLTLELRTKCLVLRIGRLSFGLPFPSVEIGERPLSMVMLPLPDSGPKIGRQLEYLLQPQATISERPSQW